MLLNQTEIDVLRRVAKFLNTACEELACELSILLEEDDVHRSAQITEELYNALLEEI